MIVLVLSCFGAQALDPRPRRGLAKVTCNCTNYPDVNTGLSSATGLVQYCSDCDCTIWNECSAIDCFSNSGTSLHLCQRWIACRDSNGTQCDDGSGTLGTSL